MKEKRKMLLVQFLRLYIFISICPKTKRAREGIYSAISEGNNKFILAQGVLSLYIIDTLCIFIRA